MIHYILPGFLCSNHVKILRSSRLRSNALLGSNVGFFSKTSVWQNCSPLTVFSSSNRTQNNIIEMQKFHIAELKPQPSRFLNVRRRQTAKKLRNKTSNLPTLFSSFIFSRNDEPFCQCSYIFLLLFLRIVDVKVFIMAYCETWKVNKFRLSNFMPKIRKLDPNWAQNFNIWKKSWKSDMVSIL